MELKVPLKTFDLIVKLLKGNTDKLEFHNDPAQKKLWNGTYTSTKLEREVPEKMGISSDMLHDFLYHMAEISDAKLHGILVACDGKILLETGFAPYSTECWHISHSLCKSVTTLAIGILRDQGKVRLNEKIVDIFEKRKLPFFGSRMKKITVKHLLTMTSGLQFNEAASLFSEDWLTDCLSSNVLFEPGTQFAYNSLNSYLLGAIVNERTGEGLLPFLKENLFNKMGIYDVYWEKCPKGREKGGWGLSMTMEDMVKLGFLYLQNGKWEGKTLVSGTFLKKAVSKQVDTPDYISPYGYGYQIWGCKDQKAYQFNGMLGQNIVMFPETKCVVATTAGSTNLFPPSEVMDRIMDTFGNKNFRKEEALPENKKGYFALKSMEKQMLYGKKISLQSKKLKQSVVEFETMKQFLGQDYEIESNSVGILPLFLQVIHGLYAAGIHKIQLLLEPKDREIIWLVVEEGNRENRIPVKAEGIAYGIYQLEGESYIVGTIGHWCRNEDDILVLKITICFIETSHTRVLYIYFQEDGIILRFREEPEVEELMDDFMETMPQETKDPTMFLANTISDLEYARYTLHKLTEPILKGKLKTL